MPAGAPHVETGHGLTDHDEPIAHPPGPAIENQVGRPIPFGNPDPAHDAWHTGPAGRKASDQIGVKEKSVKQIGASTTEPSTEPEPARDRRASKVEVQDRDLSLPEPVGDGTRAIETGHFHPPSGPTDSAGQMVKRVFGPPDLEFGDQKLDTQEKTS